MTAGRAHQPIALAVVVFVSMSLGACEATPTAELPPPAAAGFDGSPPPFTWDKLDVAGIRDDAPAARDPGRFGAEPSKTRRGAVRRPVDRRLIDVASLPVASRVPATAPKILVRVDPASVGGHHVDLDGRLVQLDQVPPFVDGRGQPCTGWGGHRVATAIDAKPAPKSPIEVAWFNVVADVPRCELGLFPIQKVQAKPVYENLVFAAQRTPSTVSSVDLVFVTPVASWTSGAAVEAHDGFSVVSLPVSRGDAATATTTFRASELEGWRSRFTGRPVPDWSAGHPKAVATLRLDASWGSGEETPTVELTFTPLDTP